jgi:hypothetical protein
MKTNKNNKSNKGLVIRPVSAGTATATATAATAEPAPVPSAATSTTPRPWRGVFFHGPEPKRNKDGDEIPYWSVYVGDADAEPVGKTYTVGTFDGAARLANLMSKDRSLELINEAEAA